MIQIKKVLYLNHNVINLNDVSENVTGEFNTIHLKEDLSLLMKV